MSLFFELENTLEIASCSTPPMSRSTRNLEVDSHCMWSGGNHIFHSEKRISDASLPAVPRRFWRQGLSRPFRESRIRRNGDQSLSCMYPMQWI